MTKKQKRAQSIRLLKKYFRNLASVAKKPPKFTGYDRRVMQASVFETDCRKEGGTHVYEFFINQRDVRLIVKALESLA